MKTLYLAYRTEGGEDASSITVRTILGGFVNRLAAAKAAGNGEVETVRIFDSFEEYEEARVEKVRKEALKLLSPDQRRALKLE